MGRPIGIVQIGVKRAPMKSTPKGDRRDWANAVVTTVKGCDIVPGSTQELLINRDEVIVAWTVLAPINTDINAYDRVVFNGNEYEIVGDPMPYVTPSRRLDHLVVLIQKWSG